jgi:UDP-2,3-diacylglucosamine hydrolase
MASKPKLGLIAGNGRFPFLVLDAARAQGYEVVIAAIKEETSPEIESRGVTVHWLSLGELSKGKRRCRNRTRQWLGKPNNQTICCQLR